MLGALPALCLVMSAAACGSDGVAGETEPEAVSTAGGGSVAPSPLAPMGDISRTCVVEVEVTGATEDGWAGAARVRVTSDGERAVYESEMGDARIAAYSAGGDVETASAIFSEDDETYTTAVDDKTGLEVKANGRGAAVSAPAFSQLGDEVQITATFTCRRPRIE